MRLRQRAYKIILMSITGLFFLPVQANFLEDFWHSTKGHYTAGVDFGYTPNLINHSTVIAPPTPELDPQKFVTKSKANVFGDYGLHLAYNIPLHNRWSLQAGLNYLFSSQQKMSGDYYANEKEPVDQTYDFNLSSQRIMLSSTVFYDMTKVWSVFGGLSIGEVNIRTTGLHFTAAPTSDGISSFPRSYSQNSRRFGYSLLLGTQYKLNTEWLFKFGIKHSWLDHLDVPINNDVSVVKVSIGQVNPWQLWSGVYYQF